MARSWDRSEGAQPRLARDVDMRYGHGLLKAESAKWPRYVAVSTPTAWKVAQPYVAQPPAGVGIVDMLDWGHLEDTSNSLPDDAELVVGIGGGVPLDASKYVALRKELPLILVPSIVSTGAIIHSMFAKWDGRHIIGDGDMPFCDFEHVVIDYDYVLEAPDYLNTAGLGDVLCGFAGITEWRYNAARGAAPPVDEAAVEQALSLPPLPGGRLSEDPRFGREPHAGKHQVHRAGRAGPGRPEPYESQRALRRPRADDRIRASRGPAPRPRGTHGPGRGNGGLGDGTGRRVDRQARAVQGAFQTHRYRHYTR